MPDTSLYYRIAYVAIALLYGGYALLLVRRVRAAAQRADTQAPGDAT